MAHNTISGIENNTSSSYLRDHAPVNQLPPPLAHGVLRIYSLGGISEIGRNMTVFEYESKILIVDCGVLFPADSEPGVDLILPDFGPIENRLEDIVGIVLTHGHEDHIGAVPFLLRLRSDIPIISSVFTLALVKSKCDEHRLKPKLIQVAEEGTFTVEPFELEFFAVNHSIPDALAVAIKVGNQVALHTGDIKLDQLPLDGRLTDLGGFSRLGKSGVDIFLVDSTNAEVPGFVMSERQISPVLDSIIAKAKQRVIVASFASHIHRIQQIVNIAHLYDRKIAFIGRSMVKNMKIAQDLGYLQIPDGLQIEIEQAKNLPENRVLLITTGSQGEPLSALSRIAQGEHKQISVKAGDLVILASSLIPGNERPVFEVVNLLNKRGVNVITQQSAKVHVSGHASAGELLYLYNAVKPKNVMPVHGEWRHLKANAELAIATGVPKENILLAEDGVVVDLKDGVAKIVGRIPVGHVYVDGLSVGDVGESTLSDRLILGEGGFITVTIVIDTYTGRVLSKPTISGRGFSDDPYALEEVAQRIKTQLNQLESENTTDTVRIAQSVRRVIGRWVSQEYRRSPMIVPNVIAVNTELN